MRVLYLVNIPSPYRIDFFNVLGKMCDLTVIFECASSAERDAKWKSDDNGSFRKIFLHGIRTGVNSAFSTGVLKYLSRKKYDVIVVGGYSTPSAALAVLYMKMRRILYVLNADGGQIKQDSGIRNRIKRFLIGGANMYLSTSQETDCYFEHYGARPDRILHYPFTSVLEKDIQGDIVENDEKREIRKKLGIPEYAKTVLAVGQFIHRKGFDLLLDTWENYGDDRCLVLVGGGSLENEYRERCRRNVFIVNFKPKDELAFYYRAADVFALPSREDIWGLVINEAMAYGLPVVSTNKCVAAVELIENGVNGFVVEADEVGQLDTVINRLLEDEKLCKRMGRYNISKVHRYTIESMAKETIKLFKEKIPNK